MRIIIDMQGAQTKSRLRGIGRYTLSFVKSIIRNSGDHEVVLLLNGQFSETIRPLRSQFDGLLPQKNIRVWESLDDVAQYYPENTLRREAAEHIREAFIMKQHPDFVLVTTFFEGFDDDFISNIGILDQNIPTAVILYDLIPLMNPELYLANPLALSWYSNKVEQCKRASLLLSISESAKQEGIKYLGVKEDAVVNISTATSGEFQPLQFSMAQQHEIKSKFGLTKDYLMYSGATDERKNHLRLISAYAKLPSSVRSRHQLAFIGGLPSEHRERFLKHASKCGLDKNELIISGRVSDNELIALYNLCKAFVFPSWHEGFGLPALEAMMCGRAVIASNTSSLPEVVGNCDALFDPYDEQSIEAKIEQVLTDDDFRSKLELHSLEQAKRFSWDSTAKHAIKAMENYYEYQYVKKEFSVDSYTNHSLQTLLINSIARLPYSYTEHDLIQIASAIAQNHQDKNKRQLLVDVSELVMMPDRKTGIQRVVHKILEELLQNPPPGYQVEPVYARIDECYCYAGQLKEKILGGDSSDDVDEPIEFGFNDIFLGLDLVHPKVLKKHFYEHMRNHGVKVVFVVYDLLPIILPRYTEQQIAEQFTHWLETIIQSDGVICISETVANDLKSWIKKHAPEKLSSLNISWFYLGSDFDSSIFSRGMPENVSTVLKSLHEGISFLMVGTIEPRKGHAQTLDAFEQLWSEGIDVNLVMVGKQGWMVEDLVERFRSHPEVNKRLFWFDGISDGYLEKVYSVSNCLIAASYGEGFGLPLIEAAQHKLPIIARDIPIFREVAAEHAFYFDTNEPEQLAVAIQNWLELYNSNQHPSSDSMPAMTWKESAAQLLDRLGVTTLELKKGMGKA